MNNLLNRSKGHWTGTKKLWLAPEKSVCECDITADVTDTAMGRSAVIGYTWSLEGERQEGHLLLTTDYGKGCVQAAWVDSFHKSTGIMILKGEFTAPDTIDLMGHYSAAPGPDWGWRMIIRAPGDRNLELINYNVTPDGRELLAIEVKLTRADA
jgi:hypothetical protein